MVIKIEFTRALPDCKVLVFLKGIKKQAPKTMILGRQLT